MNPRSWAQQFIMLTIAPPKPHCLKLINNICFISLRSQSEIKQYVKYRTRNVIFPYFHSNFRIVVYIPYIQQKERDTGYPVSNNEIFYYCCHLNISLKHVFSMYLVTIYIHELSLYSEIQLTKSNI